MSIRILSDFDGVWTDQALEALAVKVFLAAEAGRLAGVSADEAHEHFQAFEARVKAEPHAYGWAPDGRITAYVDEDPFCEANAIASYIARADEVGDECARKYRDAIQADGHELAAFADRCFMTATADYRNEHPPALVGDALASLEALHDAGAEVVVVSNSVAEKIIGWFRGAGIDAGEDDHHLVRVRGQAGKQTIGESDAQIQVAGRGIYVDRPKYRAVIEAENPDVIIGDVFSLDLALPHVMRGEGHPAAPDVLVLRKHRHTPEWVLADRCGGAIDEVVDSVGDLVGLTQRLRA